MAQNFARTNFCLDEQVSASLFQRQDGAVHQFEEQDGHLHRRKKLNPHDELPVN